MQEENPRGPYPPQGRRKRGATGGLGGVEPGISNPAGEHGVEFRKKN